MVSDFMASSIVIIFGEDVERLVFYSSICFSGTTVTSTSSSTSPTIIPVSCNTSATTDASVLNSGIIYA